MIDCMVYRAHFHAKVSNIATNSFFVLAANSD